MELGVEHITHLQWGKAKGRRTTVRRPDSCFLGFLIPWRVPFHMKKTFLSSQSGPAAPQLASPSPQSLNSSSGHANLARPSLRQPGRTFRRPDVVLHPLQSLIPPSGGTMSIGRAEPPATRTWCFTIRKALFLRPETPRHLGPIEPPAAGAWCFTVRKALFLRSEAPRLSARAEPSATRASLFS